MNISVPKLPTNLKSLQMYRLINIGFALIALWRGMVFSDLGVQLTAFALGIIDALLWVKKETGSEILQPLRLIGGVLLGPYWIYKGIEHSCGLLIIMGLALMMTDGSMYLASK